MIFFFSDGCSDSDKKDLLSELNIMKCLPQHANVIQLLGYVTRTGINDLVICDKYIVLHVVHVVYPKIQL